MCKALYMMQGHKGEIDMVLLSSGGDRHFSRSYISYLVNDRKYKMLSDPRGGQLSLKRSIRISQKKTGKAFQAKAVRCTKALS